MLIQHVVVVVFGIKILTGTAKMWQFLGSGNSWVKYAYVEIYYLTGFRHESSASGFYQQRKIYSSFRSGAYANANWPPELIRQLAC